MPTKIHRDTLGLSHSVSGLVAGLLGLALVPFLAWSAGRWQFGLVATVLLLLFGLDAVRQTLRDRRAGGDVATESMVGNLGSPDGVQRIRADIPRLLRNCLGLVAFAAASFWVASESEGSGRSLGLFFGVVLGLTALAALWLLGTAGRMFVRVDDSGILESTRPPRKANYVRWEEVESVDLMTGRPSYVALHQRGSGRPVFIQTLFLRGGAREVWRTIRSHAKYPK